MMHGQSPLPGGSMLSRSSLISLSWAVLLVAGDAESAVSIHSDQLTVRVHENGSLDILQTATASLLREQTPLGTIHLPGGEKPLTIGKAGFPGMSIRRSSEKRLDIALPDPDGDAVFHLALGISGNMLSLGFDSKPVDGFLSEQGLFLPGEESLDILQAGPAFTEAILLPEMILLAKGEAGNLVIPFQEGSLINFSSNLGEKRDYPMFANRGLTMPFWGVSTPQHSEVCIADYLHAMIQYVPGEEELQLVPHFQPDPHSRPVRLQVHFLGPDKNYIDLAITYRNELIERNELPSLEDKLRRKPELIHLLEGVNIKFPIYKSHEQRPDENGNTPPPRIYDYQSFEDVTAVVSDMKEHGVDRLMAVWWGWGRQGYDRLHPDFLPPNPSLGGEAVFVRETRAIREMGFPVGFHDNYTDIYEAAPSFEEGAHVIVDRNGKKRMGGFWAGGRCWRLCSTAGLQFAERNFGLMKHYGLNACFVDVLTASRLYDCFSPAHPHSKWGDMQNKRGMMRAAEQYFGIFGSEHGISWGADLCDYFEGITSDMETPNKWFKPVGTTAPLFSAVYHDAVLHYMHQLSPVQPEAPTRFLSNLRAGGGMYFNVVRSEYELPGAREYFLKTCSVASNVIRRTWRHPLTQHSFLTEDGGVQECVYGDDVHIVLNFSNQEYEGIVREGPDGNGDSGVPVKLAPGGFLITAPDYAAICGSQWGRIRLDAPAWIEFEPEGAGTLEAAREVRIRTWTPEIRFAGGIALPEGESLHRKEQLLR